MSLASYGALPVSGDEIPQIAFSIRALEENVNQLRYGGPSPSDLHRCAV
jgi:hypothetical protein